MSVFMRAVLGLHKKLQFVPSQAPQVHPEKPAAGAYLPLVGEIDHLPPLGEIGLQDQADGVTEALVVVAEEVEAVLCVLDLIWPGTVPINFTAGASLMWTPPPL